MIAHRTREQGVRAGRARGSSLSLLIGALALQIFYWSEGAFDRYRPFLFSERFVAHDSSVKCKFAFHPGPTRGYPPMRRKWKTRTTTATRFPDSPSSPSPSSLFPSPLSPSSCPCPCPCPCPCFRGVYSLCIPRPFSMCSLHPPCPRPWPSCVGHGVSR